MQINKNVQTPARMASPKAMLGPTSCPPPGYFTGSSSIYYSPSHLISTGLAVFLAQTPYLVRSAIPP
jgi:hypothetical protein